MPIFIKKPEVIEAFQVPQEGEEPSQEMIDFLHREEIRDQWQDGNFGELLISNAMLHEIATYGRWIVLDKDGFLDVYDDTYLQRNYSKVPEV